MSFRNEGNTKLHFDPETAYFQPKQLYHIEWLFVSHRSKSTHLFVLRYSFLVDSWHLTCTSPSYFILCVTLWRFIRGERLCLHCIEKLCDQIWWSSTEDHVTQYCRSCDPILESCDPIQEIMCSITRSCDLIQIMWSNTRSCDPIQEIMWWSNTRDHVTQYRRSCDPIQEIMWPNTGDHVTQYKRSCDPILEIKACIQN